MRGRRDNNHVEIWKALEMAGYFVIDLADLGHGNPDLLVVSKSGLVQLIEVKMPKQQLTGDERIFHAFYPGRLTICHSAEEALASMALLDELEAK